MARFLFLVLLGVMAGCMCGDAPQRLQPLPPTPVDAGPAPISLARLAQVEQIDGAVWVERKGQRLRALAGPAYQGDVFETEGDGTVLLRLLDGRDIELGADGAFELQQEGDEVVLKVRRGLVLTRKRAAPETAGQVAHEVRLTLSSAFGFTRVGAAELSMRVDETAAEVEVKVGSVEMVSKSGESTAVSAGKTGLLGAPRVLPEIVLRVVVASGRAEMKAKDAKRFSPINPKRLPALAPGDALRVKDGRLNLAPDGSQTRIALLKGAEAEVVESRRGGNREATALKLTRGEVEVAAPSGQSTRLGIGPGVTLQSDLGGQYVVRKTQNGLQVHALAGDVSLEREGQTSTLIPGGQSANIPLDGAAVVLPAVRETVTLPAKSGARIYHSGLDTVSLSWDDDGGQVQDWRVQVATDAAFTSVVRDGIVHENFISVPALKKGSWFWRVWKGDQEHAKGQASFAPEPQAEELSRLKNVVPAGPEITTIFYQDKDKPPTVTFTWNRDESAAKYLVKVYREGELQRPLAEKTVSETQVSLPDNRLDDGQYLWSVIPLDASGAELKGGRMNKLQMVFDNAVESLRIKSPRNGEGVRKVVRATGVAPVGSRLFINGKSIALDDQARFDTTVAPLPGGQVVFRLLQGGVETYTVRTLMRSR